MTRLSNWIIFAVLLTADRAAKFLAEFYLESARGNFSLPLFSLSLHHNYGISFSLLSGFPQAGLYVPFLGAALLGILCLTNARRFGTGMWFLWAGAAGNLIDRLAYGYVIDWLYVGVYINLADVWLCAGGGITLFHFTGLSRRHKMDET